MHKRLAAAFVLLSVGTTAVAAPTAPKPMPPPPALAEGQALVYIFRSPERQLRDRGSTFSVDGVKVATLLAQECTAFVAPAGEHVFKQQWPLDIGMGGQEQSWATWENGKTYHYYQTQTAERIPWPGAGREVSTKITPIESGRAATEIASCSFVAPAALPPAATAPR